MGWYPLHIIIMNTSQTTIDYYMKQQPKRLLSLPQIMNNVIKRNDAMTITFGDQAEKHVGTQKFGQLAETGFDYAYGRVRNKKARYNLCFGNDNQDPIMKINKVELYHTIVLNV